MLREVLSPGVQHRGDAELGAKMPGIPCEALQRGGGGVEQERVEPARIHAHQLATHEFEAEGPPEVVAAHFQTWQDLITAFPLAEPGGPPAAAQPSGISGRRPGGPLNLFAVDPQRKLVTLRRYPGGKAPHADAALLLLYGFHHSLGEQGRAVEVTRLKAALSASGHPGARINRTLERYRGAGLVKKQGRRKGSTYQLTASGSQRAAALAQALGTTIAPAT